MASSVLVSHMHRVLVLFLILILIDLCPLAQGQKTQAFKANNQNAIVVSPISSDPAVAQTFSPASTILPFPSTEPSQSVAENNALHDLHTTLSAMQEHYFSLWLGKWETAIDWTSAVIGTYMSASLTSLSRSIDYTMPGTFDKSKKLDVEAQMVENEINKYFAQTLAFYFGEEAFAIRMQAFDDMLWVVLGWLEAIQFVSLHSVAHYSTPDFIGDGLDPGQRWHGSQFVPSFAHRARVFYELAEEGWDWRLCGGGMNWNPRLLPYKNAITNELFISASISMYLHFPGDENCSPFLSQGDQNQSSQTIQQGDICNGRGQYDPVFLQSAINGYDWLQGVGMMNDQGLYVDGFHISGYRQNHSRTTCDERNEMVYTYNQGVILTGLRGLWEATGTIKYLGDGHELVRNVIAATGWKLDQTPQTHSFATQSRKAKRQNDPSPQEGNILPGAWHGLGAYGILTELCDPSGRCSQDGQSFKGIFFHHLTTFCAALPTRSVKPGRTHGASRELRMLHDNSCDEYMPWVVRNAQAALRTRDAEGRFGSWWGADTEGAEALRKVRFEHLSPVRANDMRSAPALHHGDEDLDGTAQPEATSDETIVDSSTGDVHDRGRGRTVETQGAGVAVVRAMWEFLRRAESRTDAS